MPYRGGRCVHVVPVRHLAQRYLAVRQCLDLHRLASGLVRRFVVKTVFSWVAIWANILYLAVRTHNRAVVCLHELVLQLCGSSGPAGYPRKRRSYHKTAREHRRYCGRLHPGTSTAGSDRLETYSITRECCLDYALACAKCFEILRLVVRTKFHSFQFHFLSTYSSTIFRELEMPADKHPVV